MNSVKKIIKHPFFITSVSVFILILLFPFPFPEYELSSSFKVLNNSRVHRDYADFDNDGNSEFIRFQSVNLAGRGATFIISKADGNIIYREVLPANFGSVSHNNDILCEDLFDTGIKSTAFITNNEDTSFLFVFSLLDSNYVVYGHPFKKDVGSTETNIKWLGTRKNSQNEVLLYFWLDYSEESSSCEVVCFNVNQEQSKSFVFDAMHPQIKVLKNQDDVFTIVINTISNKSINDDLAWDFATTPCKLIKLNEDLELIGDPLILADSYGYADLEIIENAKNKMPEFFVFLWNFGIVDENRKLLKFDINMNTIFAENINEVVSELLIIEDAKKELYVKTTSKNYWLVNQTDGTLSKPLVTHLCLDGYDYIASAQLDRDDNMEHVLFNAISNEIIVMRKGFKNSSSFVVSDENLFFDRFSTRVGKNYSIVIPGDTYINRITYASTIWVWLKYPLWFTLLFVLNLFVWFRSQLRKKKELELLSIERKITDLQLQNFRNQLDPHFTFNALNVIGSVIYKEDKDVAYDYFTRFSRLMRSSLLDSTKITRELDAELQFTIDYLEFQKFRFKDKFDYLVELDSEIDKTMPLPKMLIQGYAENAIRHGFYEISYKGLLSIKLNKTDSGTFISISDNGIGRKAALELNTSKGGGRGMNVMEEQINLFNKYNMKQMTVQVVDVEDDGRVLGTAIEIFIPTDFSFTISRTSKS